MNIAIVDDQRHDRLVLAEKIKNYMQQNHLSYELFEYTRAEDFVNSISTMTFSIVFMDIYMDKMTGMEAAVLLRQKDKDCKLIFLTESEEYLRQGYSVNASHYLFKPVTDKLFLEAMENCRIRPNYEVPYLDFVANGIKIHLDTGLIQYINLMGRTVYIHTAQQVFSLRSAFSTLTEPLLSDPRFLVCIQGVMVNMDHISSSEDSAFIMKSGDRIPVNLRNRKRIMQLYRNYIFENMGR